MRAFTLALAVAALCSGPVLAQSVGGKYTVQGTNPDKSPYSGTAEITPSGDSCRIAWQTGSSSSGICMLANKAFAAAYKLGDGYGLAVYELQPDGTLKGVWTMADQAGVGTEILTPVK
jgi:hypothetical protein